MHLPPPVLLGADLHAYSLAQAFYAAARTPVYVYGKSPLGPTRFCKNIFFTAVPDLSSHAALLSCLLTHKKRHFSPQRPLLIPCTDEYAVALAELADGLSPHYYVVAPPRLSLPLGEKDIFYTACRDHGIVCPATVTLTAMPAGKELRAAASALGMPFIIKPACSVSYWHHPFPGMKKVYLATCVKDAEKILSAIFFSGYPDKVLLQQYIPGGDAAGRVLTVYIDRNGNPRLYATGRVLLEEHTPRGRGNYAALVTEKTPATADKLCRLLSAFSYRGFANFDLRHDEKSGTDYLLELNMRLGRSNGFLTAGGHNPASLLIRDLYEKEDLPHATLTEQVLYRTLPLSVLLRYISPADRELCRDLHHAKKDFCPFYDRSALLSHPLRPPYVFAHMQRQRKKFARFCTAESSAAH